MTRSAAREAWQKTLGTLALVLVMAALFGLAIGRFWMALAIAALGVLVWHYWRLHGILARLTARQRLPPPEGNGIWNELDRLLSRSQREMRARKRRLISMLRAYRAATAALPDAIVVVDRNTQRAQWFNKSAERLLGLAWPRDLGIPLGPVLSGLSVPNWLANGRHAEILLDESSPANPSIRLTLRLIPYSEELWLLVARDVSKLMRLEQVRRDFVANVSHELRTPLTVLHGYLDMLEPDENAEWHGIVPEMRKQSERMNQLVEDLLTLSRLDAHERSPDEVVSMAPMLVALRREAEALSQGRHRISLRDDASVDLWGSTKELHSAFSNLVSNAVRYTPVGGHIEILFEPVNGDVALRVRDSGYGIPAQHIPRLTERFYRVSTSRSRETGGTGLGLAIVKHVLGLHGARLDIESEVGRGSVFSCVLPRERAHPRRNAAATPAPPHPSPMQ
ncbi:phosphate regulon sensor histidine kinase PhoR [Lysobacter pythonis]|uniref:Phosphate regulon sensor protein PhoR n=1 Tax=Solilutibacter pythonis TaxID=2483112 RepID=A0A3M2I237_9GAMM|nr:phosphate regulon sensor histidine kinase PhoR [Lysobacter pythonis]RMH94465.1 phosphate regulon sensor histidine kinase PhoR [Lysobacter pythonis]